MEKLSIKEIVDHCNKKVKWWEKFISREKFENRDANDSSVREYWEHRQVAEYLKELQQYRAIGNVQECREAREKAIDEFAKEIEAEYDNDACPNVTDYLDYKISIRDLFKIAERIKNGEIDR